MRQIRRHRGFVSGVVSTGANKDILGSAAHTVSISKATLYFVSPIRVLPPRGLLEVTVE